MEQMSQESAPGSPAEDTYDKTPELLAKMSKYIFDHQGLKLAHFDGFWTDFLRDFPEFSHMEVDDLRLIFICTILPVPFGKNAHNFPAEEWEYLKYGDWDADEQELSDEEASVELTHGDVLATMAQKLHRDHPKDQMLQEFAKNLLQDMNMDDLNESSDSQMDFSNIIP